MLHDEIRDYAKTAAQHPDDRAFNARDLRRAFRSTPGANIPDILRALADLYEAGELRLTTTGEFEAVTE